MKFFKHTLLAIIVAATCCFANGGPNDETPAEKESTKFLEIPDKVKASSGYDDPVNPLHPDHKYQYAAGQRYFQPPERHQFNYRLDGLPDPILGHGLEQPILRPWYELKHQAKETIGLHTNFSYTIWSQWASKTHSVPGKATPDAMVNGRLDLLGYLELPENALGKARINFLARQGTNYGWSTGTVLDTSIGDVSGVNAGYNPSICLNLINYEQELMDGKVSFQIGKIQPGWYLFASPVADDETSQFINGSFDGNGGWALNNYAPGMILRLHELFGNKDLYFYAAGVDMADSATTALGGLDEGKWGGVFEFGWTPKFGELQGHYRFDYWYSDNSYFKSESGSGFGINFDQEIAHNLVLFLTYAHFCKETYNEKDQLSAGMTILEPFKRRGEMFGLAGNYTKATQNNNNEYVIESFYRFQLTDSIQFSPDFQLIFNPAFAPETNVCAVLGARVKFQF